MNKSTKYIILEIIAVAFLATGGIFVRTCGISPVNCGFYRILFSLPFLYPLARKEQKTIQRKDKAILLVSGIFFATDIGLANLAYQYTSVANVNLLSTLTPLTVIPITCFVFKERMPKYYFIGAAAALAGVVILVGGKNEPVDVNYVGDLLAFSASVFYALFLLVSYKMRRKYSGSTILFWTGIGSVITFFVYAGLLEGVQIPQTRKDLLAVLGLSICMQVIGQGLFTYCQGKISVNVSSIVGLVQPAFGAVFAWILFEEILTTAEIIGIIIVMIGIYIVKKQS